MIKGNRGRIAAFLLGLCVLLTSLMPPAHARSGQGSAPTIVRGSTGLFSCGLTLNDGKYLNMIQEVSVNGGKYTRVNTETELNSGKRYCLHEADVQVKLSKSSLKRGDRVEIRMSSGTLEAVFTDPNSFLGSIYDKASVKFTPAEQPVKTEETTPKKKQEKQEKPEEKQTKKPETKKPEVKKPDAGKPTPEAAQKPGAKKPDGAGQAAQPAAKKPETYALKATVEEQLGEVIIRIEPKEALKTLSGVSVNHSSWREVDSKWQTFYGGSFFNDKSEGKLYVHSLKDGDLVQIRLADKTQSFTYNAQAKTLTPVTDEALTQPKVLKLRLHGAFEAAMEGQRKYDGISGASTSVTSNRNSNVVVQVAEVSRESDTPKETDWVLLKDCDKLSGNPKNRRVIISEETGMKGVYSPYDSSLSLSGTPKKAGKYDVYVEIEDAAGRKVESNKLPFNIYSTATTLSEALKARITKQTQDGKAMWDMEPWYIAKFGADSETVTVPSEIKAWFGSHTSGTYGHLGLALGQGEATTQTLIIDRETDLTLTNMIVKSSVKIIVRDGGKLNLRDSSVYGQIVVERGGIFQMNYDAYGKKFLTGAQINGQLILEEGAKLETSMIYSNANFLTDGVKAKRISDPVVLVRGDATLCGQVFIKGDESATGYGEDGGRLPGQPALKIERGKLTIEDGSTLGVYGGGKLATTSRGGKAIILDQGTIDGQGSLIAVGGSGTMGEGGDAVSGEGRIAVKRALLQGGNVYFGEKVGLAHGAKVQLDGETVGKAMNGRSLKASSDSDQPLFWNGILTPPTLDGVDYGDKPIAPSGKVDEQVMKPEEEAEPLSDAEPKEEPESQEASEPKTPLESQDESEPKTPLESQDESEPEDALKPEEKPAEQSEEKPVKARILPIDRTLPGYEDAVVEAYDISFVDDAGEKVTFSEAQEIEISLKQAPKGELKIFHERADGTMEPIAVDSVEGHKVTFRSADFSPFFFVSERQEAASEIKPDAPTQPDDAQEAQIRTLTKAERKAAAAGHLMKAKAETASAVTEAKVKQAPKTGDESMPALYVAAAVVAAGAAIALKRKQAN